MMTDFEIRFTPREKNMDQRPPGARELINALGDYAEGTKPLSKQDVADAHNYICALESKVCGLYHELEAMKQQEADRLDHLLGDRKLAGIL
jgi:hypothetical protein